MTAQEEEETAFAIRDSYEGAECPDCGLPISINVKDGEGCKGCGHVFCLPEPDSSED